MIFLPPQCDTFSRSSDAVFELSLRFAEPFKISEDLSPEARLEEERLMFLELTQGDSFLYYARVQVNPGVCSLSLG
jgi:hypothetical protein